MIILVTGDREWNDILVVHNALNDVVREFGLPVNEYIVVHGYCRGADLTAEVCAKTIGMRTICCPAHWHHNSADWVKFHGPCSIDCTEVSGKAAGVIRNGFMLDTYDPALVLAFHDNLPASVGTYDMIRRSRRKGKEVRLYTYNGLALINPPLTKAALIKQLHDVRPKSAQERFLDL